MKTTPYPAPDFSLVDSSTGDKVTLDAFAGKWLVLYFYPKDDTPGCTIEACSMRDTRDQLTELGAEVVGISSDEPGSHEKFKAKYNLNFSLLSDPDHTAINAYGAWGKKQFGKEGILRKTFLIDAEGIVQHVYGRVTPAGHGDKVIDDLRQLQGAER